MPAAFILSPFTSNGSENTATFAIALSSCKMIKLYMYHPNNLSLKNHAMFDLESQTLLQIKEITALFSVLLKKFFKTFNIPHVVPPYVNSIKLDIVVEPALKVIGLTNQYTIIKYKKV